MVASLLGRFERTRPPFSRAVTRLNQHTIQTSCGGSSYASTKRAMSHRTSSAYGELVPRLGQQHIVGCKRAGVGVPFGAPTSSAGRPVLRRITAPAAQRIFTPAYRLAVRTMMSFTRFRMDVRRLEDPRCNRLSRWPS